MIGQMAVARNPIRRLLVANRGEIACRIMRTARRMNIETLAIYSSADRGAMHVKLADQAHYVGEPEPQRSYLNQERILKLARDNQVSAIHPGYGFLSENSEFSQRCQDERVLFVGPKAESIRLMGIKNASKEIMTRAGVPVVPGYHGLDQDDQLLLAEANKIGWPVLIKPVRGGGGKGMRIVHREEDFLAELESSRRESLKSFNDQTMLLEKYIVKPRHIEVQVFGDLYGNYVYLYERDCSVQRRHQKIIEEAPAPLLDDEKRHELGQMAVAAARAVDYVGAGTVEFIFDKSTGQFYFMEMNTRLQVEHPITEMITQTDLVEWQLRVASGEPLPKLQPDITYSGHAFEARIYAESPRDNFLPQTGRLDFISAPGGLLDSSGPPTHSGGGGDSPEAAAIRLDTGVTAGDTISPYYDPMIAKLIVWGPNREEALRKINLALSEYVIRGLPTNINFLKRLTENRSFQEADLGTDFIELHHDELFSDANENIAANSNHEWAKSKQTDRLLGQCAICIHNLLLDNRLLWSNQRDLASFRMLGMRRPVYEFEVNVVAGHDDNADDHHQLILKAKYESLGNNRGFLSLANGKGNGTKILNEHVECELDPQSGGEVARVWLGEQRDRVYKFELKSPILSSDEQSTVVLRDNSQFGQSFSYVSIKRDNCFQGSNGDAGHLVADPLVARAPMPGIIEKILVSEGDQVSRGQSLVVLSAMKMEYSIKAAADGRVAEIKPKVGDFVAKESALVRLLES